MGCKEQVEDYLKAQGVQFQEVHHPLAYTAQDVAASEHVSGRLVAKVVMAMSGDKPYMLVLPASLKVDLEKARQSLGLTDLRLASESDFERLFPGCEVGAMPPFGNLYGLPVYVDPRLAEDPEIIFQAGTHTETIKIRYSDFERLVHPQVRDLAHAA
ncbi:MAG: YbaK/EbsC family protein [Chloroflexota bacterium]|nr:MAG: YbaK/EbsC family protein [Chloroflexota bacterium]